MAASTVFINNRDELVARLRLTQANDKGDLESVVDAAMVEARLSLYKRLGTARVAQIKAMTWSISPSTADELTRALGATVETKMVRLALMATMPTLFMDSGAQARDQWNEENTFRHDQQRSRETRERLEQEIAEGLDELAADDAAGSERVQASSFGGDADSRIEPGSTIWTV